MIGYRPGTHTAVAGMAEVELQADVMRFVAILALCLVAISSLVESATGTPPAPPSGSVSVMPEPDDPAATPAPVTDAVVEQPKSIETDSSPVAAPVSPTPPPSTAVPVADAGAATPLTTVTVTPTVPVVRSPSPLRQAPAAPERKIAERPEPVPQPVSPTRPDRRGFTLRFESDAALLRLVSRGEASVFIFDGPRALRLGFGPDGAQFTVATTPRSFHAIAPETVPAVLRDTLRKQGLDASPVWGVTLPEQSRRSLAKLLREHEHGTLTIDSRGRVRLEGEDEV